MCSSGKRPHALGHQRDVKENVIHPTRPPSSIEFWCSRAHYRHFRQRSAWELEPTDLFSKLSVSAFIRPINEYTFVKKNYGRNALQPCYECWCCIVCPPEGTLPNICIDIGFKNPLLVEHPDWSAFTQPHTQQITMHCVLTPFYQKPALIFSAIWVWDCLLDWTTRSSINKPTSVHLFSFFGPVLIGTDH